MNKILILIVLLAFLLSCNRSPRNVKVIDPDSIQMHEGTIDKGKEFRSLKVAVSAILSPRETYESYEEIFEYISEKIGLPVEFHQKRTYQEINQMLESGQLDFAFICSGAYIDLNPDKGVELLVIPVCEGRKFYNSYIIAQENFRAEKLEDLQNSSFAYTDPMSNSGYLHVIDQLLQMGEDYERYFGSTVFTYGHDISIQMVSKGIVEAASVSNLVYEYLKVNEPERILNVKVIEVSQDYGMPPVVVSSRMNEDLRAEIFKLFTEMHQDKSAQHSLSKLLIDKFVPGVDSDYNSIREMRFNVNH
jgi:phosphonate transport system substrate-binding protein